jgi:hypothetical protein
MNPYISKLKNVLGRSPYITLTGKFKWTLRSSINNGRKADEGERDPPTQSFCFGISFALLQTLPRSNIRVLL